MKSNYLQIKTLLTLTVFALFVVNPKLSAQVLSYTFTNCSATGKFGPTQAQVTAGYVGTSNSLVVTTTPTSGIQTWTVPFSGNYRIEAWGAKGGDGAGNLGGNGARMQGDFTLTAGSVLHILVGQMGGSRLNGGANTAGAGGGGSFVSFFNNVPIIVAGGGGGAGSSQAGLTGTTGLNGTQSVGSSGLGGISGGGGGGALSGTAGTSLTPGGNGSSCSYGAGGGGYYTRGGYNCSGAAPLISGFSYTSGGLGGDPDIGNGGVPGGFGCGAGVGHRASAGGGYSGGGGDGGTNGGGGGGSFNSGTNQVNVSGFNNGHGRVVITPLCNISLNSSSNPICAGTSVTLTTDAISNYSWSTGAATSSIVVTPAVNTVYSIVATSSANCTAAALITLSVAAAVPNLTLTNNTPSLCPGQSATLTASGATTYVWSGGVTNGISFTPAITQVYTVTGTNPCGSTNATTSIFMNPTPTVTATASTPSLCSGSSATLIGGGAVNYTWSPFVVNGAGFFPNATVTYTVVGAAANGCTNSAVATISVVTTPVTPPSVAPALICNNGSTATLTSTGATNYTWMPGSFSTAVIVVNPTTTTVYTITRSNANCVSTATITLLVNQLPPVFAIASPTSVCAFNTATLSGGGALTYTWFPYGGTNANAAVTPSAATIFTVSASDGTCVNTATVLLSTRPNPTISISASGSVICVGQTASLTANSATAAPALTYTWGAPFTSSLTSVTVSPASTTLITVAGTNSAGCTSSANQPMIVNPNPTLNVTANKQMVCINAPAILSVSGANNYTWVTTGTGISTTVNPNAATFYTVIGSYSNTGCSTTSGILINVYDPSFTVPLSPSTCVGGTITLTASGAASYTWATNPPSPFPSIAVSPSVYTVYQVSATSTPSNGLQCPMTNTVGVSIYQNPTVTAVSERSVICRNESVNLIGGGASTYTWVAGQFQISGSTVAVSPLAQTLYSVTGKDVNGCIGTTTLLLKVLTCTGVDELNLNNNLVKIFPNPSTGKFTIQGENELELNLINDIGQHIKSIKLTAQNNYKVEVMDLAKGIYFIITSDEKAIRAQKIIVTK